MRILFLGATGSVGLELIQRCLDTFSQATLVIYARQPSKVPAEIAQNRSVIIIQGQLDDELSLKKALEGVDVVLSALGPHVQKGPFYSSGTPLAKAYERICSYMHSAQPPVKRIILLGTTSISDSNDGSDWAYTTMVTTVSLLARNAYKEFVKIGEVFSKEKDLDYTIIRVPVLTHDKSTESNAGYIGDSKMTVFLSRAAYAAFAVNEIQRREWVQKMPLVTSP